MTFIRHKEDFTCAHCATIVNGDGYTNHCPECLTSRHVDVEPGDRQAECGGLMRPIRVEQKHGEPVLVQECVSCGHTKRNKVTKADNQETLRTVSRTSYE